MVKHLTPNLCNPVGLFMLCSLVSGSN